MSEQEKSAVKITVTYDDGTTKELEKGLVWCITDKPESREEEIMAEMVSMSGKDLFTIVGAAIELGGRGFWNPDIQRVKRFREHREIVKLFLKKVLTFYRSCVIL